MYEVALSVAGCVRSGTRADIAWIVEADGLPDRDRGEALVVTPGGGRIGRLLGGALDDQVAAVVGEGSGGRLVDVAVDPVAALIADLPAGARTRCLIVAADAFPPGLWDDLWSGRPACVVVHLDGSHVSDVEVFTAGTIDALDEPARALFRREVTDSLVEPGRVVTALWPVPRLAIVGGGAICDAVEVAARPLGWQVLRFGGADAGALLMGFGALDMVLVAQHDLDAAGATLSAALAGRAGYVGALGSTQMSRARLDWLTTRGVSGLERIHGPAGLDLGANRPAEVAIAVIAEALAVRAGRAVAVSDRGPRPPHEASTA